MANVKITELTAITAPASSDVLAIVDVDADVTKKVTIANLVGSAAPGSFGAPSFGFADDDDTGMYRAAADQLGFATTGAERFRIDDAGNLHISGDSKYLYLSSDDNQWIRGDASTDFIQFGTSNSERLRIDSSGQLDVASGIIGDNVSDNFTFLGKTQPHYGFNLSNGGTNSPSGMSGYYGIAFATAQNERMRISSAGNVGIGQTSPAQLLHLTSSGSNAFLQFSDSGSGGSAAQVRIGSSGNDLVVLNNTSSNTATERMRVTSDGNVKIVSEHLRFNTSGKGIIFGTDGGSNRPSIVGNYTSSSDNNIVFNVTGSERMRINSSGDVGIGTSSPSSELQVNGDSDTQIRVVCSSGGSAGIQFGDTGDVVRGGVNFDATGNNLTLRGYNNTERVRINSSGQVGIAQSSPTAQLDVKVPGNNYQSTTNTFGVRSPNDNGFYVGTHYDGSGAGCDLVARGYSSTMGGFRFKSVNGSYASPTERMRILGDGVVLTQTTSTNVLGGSGSYGHRISASGITLQVASDVYPPAAFNRANNDGSVVEIRQAGAIEGTISVSGSTVSYNGGHLARWSQLPGGAERTEILRGSVLSNLDEMCEWGDEDNEQLNRMQVSSVEGDPNVSGVFQAWDDDDDTYTNDFYCAMTGDFIIRIAQGTTVARGDLLMSAGDGTAKPQDDDIVRSKTIAKVTSTTVSETYSDGSYCVPCVLMAC